MVFESMLIDFKKMLLYFCFFGLNNGFAYAKKNVNNAGVYSDDKDVDDHKNYSTEVISEKLGFLDDDDDVQSKKQKNDNNVQYPQPYYPQPYYQQPNPNFFVIGSTPNNVPNNQNYQQQNNNRNVSRNNAHNRGNNSKSKKNNGLRDKEIELLKKNQDMLIFSNNYNFGDYTTKVKSYKAFTIHYINFGLLTLVTKIMNDKKKHFQKPNESGNRANRPTWGSFLAEEFTSYTEQQDYRVIGLAVKLLRIFTNVKWEWKHISNKHFAVSFELAHLLCPGLLLEVNTGYHKKDVFGGGIKIGLSCGIGTFLTYKSGTFYVKFDGPCISLITLAIALKNNTFKNNTQNERSKGFWSKPTVKKIIDKHFSKWWTFKFNEGTPFGDKGLVHDIFFGSMSLGLGWIYPNIDLYDY